MAPTLNSPLPPLVVPSSLSLVSGDLSATFRFLETFLPLSFAEDLSDFNEGADAEGIVDGDW